MNLSSLIDRLDELRTEFTDAFGDLPEEVLKQRPSPEAWSIGENLQHLIVFNESYFPTFEAIVQGRHKAPWHAKLPFLPKLFGKLLLKAVRGSKKVKTFSIWEPSESELPPDILKKFQEHQEKLKGWYRELTPYTGQGIKLASPASSSVVYPLETSLELLVSHEARHLEQAKGVLEGIVRSEE